MFERWRGTLFWVLLVYGIAAAVLAGVGLVEYLSKPGGPTSAQWFGLVFRITGPVIILGLAWFVFRPHHRE